MAFRNIYVGDSRGGRGTLRQDIDSADEDEEDEEEDEADDDMVCSLPTNRGMAGL
jgi:hypothetical protein